MNMVVDLEGLSINYTPHSRRFEQFISMAASVHPLRNIDVRLHVGLGNSPSIFLMASSLKGKLGEGTMVGFATRA